MALVVKDWKDAPDTTTPLSAAALEDMETRLAAYADTLVPSAVTSVPGSPTEGQEIYYRVSDGVIWHLRYRSAVSGTYKWEFLGGAPIVATPTTGESTTSGTHTTYQNLADGAVSVTAPLAGIYDMAFGAYASCGTANSAYISVKYSGSEAIDGDGILGTIDPASTWVALAHEPQPLTVASASTAITLRFRAISNLTLTYGRRRLRITPRQVI